MHTTHNWKRFWHLREVNVSLSDDGFLYDPCSKYGDVFNPNLLTLESIAKTPCLILLGEPGIGKTQELNSYYDYKRNNLTNSEDRALMFNLGDYQTEDRLYKEIFEQNEVFQSWLKSNNKLHLFFDGFDEALLSIHVLAKGLANQLRKYICDRLDRITVCIACRSGEWPSSLEENLKELWKDQVKVYQLCPLRKKDVIEAAKNYSLNSDNFLQEIQNKGVTPLAIKPITLQMLIKLYKQNNKLPKTQQGLYEEGCLLLCKENNKDRSSARAVTKLSEKQKLILAGRIAVITIFTNRSAIWVGSDSDSFSEEYLTVSEICGETEAFNCEPFWVDESKVRECLQTGLFSSHCPHSLVWSHQTYLEYLAAWYLVKRNMKLTQIMSLIQNTVDFTGKLIPQLYQVSAWLATMRKDVFDEIMKVEPQVLLRSDITTVDNNDKALLVERILALFEKEIVPNRWVFTPWYKKLKYSGLSEQLRPYIIDTNKHIESRYQAIKIIEACEEKTLVPDLVNRVFDPSEYLLIRQACTRTIKNIGDAQAKKKLKPLAFGEVDNDPEDELKGYALMANWPEHMNIDELLQSISPPKEPNLHGLYESFLLSDFEKHLSEKDLFKALTWIKEEKMKTSGSKNTSRFEEKVMKKAWEYLQSKEFLEIFTEINLLNLKNNNSLLGILRNKSKENIEADEKCHKIFEQMLSVVNRELLETLEIFCKRNTKDDEAFHKCFNTILLILTQEQLENLKNSLQENNQIDEESLKILDKMLSLVSKPRNLCFHLYFYTEPKLITSRDVLWLINYVKKCNVSNLQLAILDLLDYLINWDDQQQYEAIISAVREENSIFAAKFGIYVDAIILDSPLANTLRQQHEEKQKELAKRTNITSSEILLAKNTNMLLERCEKGKLDAWWQLNQVLMGDDRINSEFESDITELQGWKIADDATKIRIIQAAKKYLEEQNPNADQWLGKEILYRPAYAAFRAFRLLFYYEGMLRELSSDVWKKWSVLIVGYPMYEASKEFQKQLVNIAYTHAPDEIIQALLLMIDKQDKSNLGIRVVQLVEDCWDERIANAIFDKLQKKKLTVRSKSSLIACLLKHRFPKAKDCAERFMPKTPFNKIKRTRAICLSNAFVENEIDGVWPLIWSVMEKDDKYAEIIISNLANYSNSNKVVKFLKPKQLSDLYVFVEKKYPTSEDPYYEGVHGVGTREQIGFWRNQILTYLSNMGTVEAGKAIEEITKVFSYPWIKMELSKAQLLGRSKEWNCPKPEYIIQMVKNQNKRLIENGEQLLELLIESLQRLEVKLQGETIAAEFLWDEFEKGKYKPKDENSLSNFVKLHLEELKDKGIIVNREVEIRRTTIQGTGQNTDIQVNAITKNSSGEVFDTITVIIETKGCWHQEVEEAMETQLVNRYLKNNVCKYGLYLIGYYNCEQWHKDDYRKGRSLKISLDQAREQFNSQAFNLSQNGIQVRAFVLNTSLPEAIS